MKALVLVLLTAYCLLLTTPIYAAGYILPYPSYMPGHKLYKLEQIWDSAQEYWHFGNIAKFKYHQGLADKKLVEAKVLFEHEQYLLAVDAIQVSNSSLIEAGKYLGLAIQSGKQLNRKTETYKQALDRHKEDRIKLRSELPKVIIWEDENNPPVKLNLYEELHI